MPTMAESARTTCVANRASMRFCRSPETRPGPPPLPTALVGDRPELVHEEETIKANASSPQPDGTFFPSARTEAVPSDGQNKKACDCQRSVATLRGKFNGKPVAYTANHKNLASYVGY